MEENFIENIFKNLDIIIDKKYNLKINDINYLTKSKQLKIFMQSEELLLYEVMDKLELHIKEYLELGDEVEILFYYNVKTDTLTDEELEKYFNKIIMENKEIKNILLPVKYTIKNRNIEFILNFKYEMKIIENLFDSLTTLFKNYGIENISFSFNSEMLEEQNKKFIEKAEIETAKQIAKENTQKKSNKNRLIFGSGIQGKIFEIKDIINPDNMLRNVAIEGIVFNKELRELKNSSLLTIMIYDPTGTIIAKSFTGFGGRPPTYFDLNKIQVGMKISLSGKKNYDKFINDEIIEIESLMIIDDKNAITYREDTSDNKRIELHLHSKMSKNNGISSMEEYAKLAKHFGHSALGITDHNSVQGFVEAEKVSKKYDLKIAYGIESVIVPIPEVVRNPNNQNIQAETYTVFDLETTGLSANFNKLIEIGAVKIKNGHVLERFQCFVKIDERLSEFTTSLTGITDSDLDNGLELKKALELFRNFYEGTTLVAHNATFDYQFLNKNERTILQKDVTVPVLDTLELSRILNPDNTFHSLKILTKKYGVDLTASGHHRADYDAEKLSELFMLMLKQIEKEFPDFKTLANLNETNVNKTRGFHDLIYVKNQEGLKDLYELISIANTEDFLLEPRIRRNYLDEKRKNLLLVGSGCLNSTLMDYYLNKTEEELINLVSYYDYIDINPSKQYNELISNGTFKNEQEIIDMQKKLIEIAEDVQTNVIGTSNAHFTNPELYKIKEILLGKDFKPDKMKKDKETGEEHPIDKIKFKNLIAEKESKFKSQYYHSTDEMIDEFTYLDDEIKNKIIFENPQKLVDELDELTIVPDDLFTPKIDGVEEKLVKMVYARAREIYGEDLPQLVIDRIEKETNSIIKYGFSVIYYISYKLVKYSLDNGYLVGSRGSVGSSIVATFMGITEINPLPPHYVCSKCQKSEFFLDGEYGSGFDLPNKKCPNCDIEYEKNGQDIPFETFLGFEGDKVPDIDLNFSGEFQAKAHDYVRSKNKISDPELFDEDHAFKAGTIGTIAEKTAYAYTKNYFDLLDEGARKSDITFYAKECEGIKRTTGQHPGGIIVVPEDKNIYDFTAIQYPADDKKQPWRTTHFDFHSIHDNILKLDILGHDDPTMLKRLYDLTGVNPEKIDVSDEKIMQLFTSTKSLEFEDLENFKLGTMGIPEFGTDFVMGMLLDTKPKTFSELVQISGLSHGTDVWLGNAKELIDKDICELKDVIGCRDDIMVFLMYQSVEPKIAFSIMENVRKGKGLTNEEITILKNAKIPDWYIDSCQKIKYMFPKAHAAAYVLMALRIAYYKVYYPLEYYCAYFSSRIDDFDPISMLKGKEYLLKRIDMLNNFDTEISDVKKKNLMNSLKMSLEMTERNFSFLNFDLEKSQAHDFVIDFERNGLIMPFGIIEGLGEKEAQALVEARNEKPFSTKEDIKKRAKIKKKSLEQLEYFNVLENLDDSNQLTLF